MNVIKIFFYVWDCGRNGRVVRGIMISLIGGINYVGVIVFIFIFLFMKDR